MRFRTTTAAVLATALAIGVGGCNRQVSDVPDDDRRTPDELPLIEPVSPPANRVERPDDVGPGSFDFDDDPEFDEGTSG